MIKAASLLAAFVLGSSHAVACPDARSNRPYEREQAHALALLHGGKFDELDALDKRSLDPLARLSDGQSLRGAFADALSGNGITCSRASKEEKSAMLAAHRAKLAAWRSARPDATTPLLMEALMPVVEAWIVRGNGYASEVRPEAWPEYRRLMGEAEKQLEGLPARAKDDPAWYELRIGVANYQSDRKALDENFRKAIERYPTYTPTYFAALSAKRDQWGGNAQQRSDFIEEAVRRTRGAMGETMYARLHWASQDRSLFQSREASWPRMKEGFTTIVKDYPDPWNVNHYAKFACLAQDPATLNELLPQIQGHVMIEAWGDISFYKWCQDFAALNAQRR